MAIRIGRVGPNAQYIGRSGKGVISPLGNPFIIGRDGDRDEVCDLYEAWFQAKVEVKDPAVMQELRRLYRIAKDGDLTLGCFCAPQRCHGETIKRFLEQYLQSNP